MALSHAATYIIALTVTPFLFLLPRSSCCAAFVVPFRSRSRQATGIALSAAKGGRMERPANEFSRSYRVEGILSGGQRQRDYSVKVEATDDELARLANRFDVNRIYRLEADVAIRRERLSTSSAYPGVEVEGMVTARVDQVCVRTGEIFDVDVQFPLFAVVRPIASLGLGGGASKFVDDDVPDEVLEYAKEQKDIRKNTKKKRDRTKSQSHNLNEMDMGELQKLLQDFDVEDDVIEDEAIYSMDGLLDLGELVSQLFWLKLDPYPKKPGSNPVWTSITG